MRLRVASCAAGLLAAFAPGQSAPAFENLTSPPPGLPPMPLPADYRPTAAAFGLGAELFADPILSRDRTVACASCHRPDAGFASPEPLPAGVRGKRARRHAPSLFNRGYGRSQRWDGGTATLDEQVLLPIQDPDEMALPLREALQRLRQDDRYRSEFRRVFGRPPGERELSLALSTYVRGIVRGDSPVDRFQAGDIAALTKEQKAGLWLFESKAGCWQCHPPPLFTDESFHNTGIGVAAGAPRPGRFAVTGDPADRGRFKTPTLRGVELTAPYMHDGSLKTLREVLEFYRRGGNANDHLDPKLRPLELSDREMANLSAFLQAL